MSRKISAEDRFAITDVLGRYLLAVDTGKVPEILAQFAPDAVVRYEGGERYQGTAALAEFARKAVGGTQERGRMHFNQPLFVEPVGDDIVMYSYLMVPQRSPQDESMTIVALRCIKDRFRRAEQGWLIAERVIFKQNGNANLTGTPPIDGRN